jgi:hypothetical protein
MLSSGKGGEMKRILVYLSLATIMPCVASADIIQINDLTETLSVTLVPNSAAVGTISALAITGETVTFTYNLPAGLVFGGNFNSFRDMLEGPGEDTPAGSVSDIFRAVWAQGSPTAAVSFSSDPDMISVDGATQLPSITEIGGFQSVVTVGALNLDFQVASDVPEPYTALECAGGFLAIVAGLYSRRRGRR